MIPSDVVALVGDRLLGMWSTEREQLERIDRWARWSHDRPHRPTAATNEYRELADRSEAPWGDLLVQAVTQTLYVEGYRHASDADNATPWAYWQRNSFDARQMAIHAAAVTYGQSFAFAVRGVDMPVMRGVSPRQMVAVYDDPAFDEWPQYALRVRLISPSTYGLTFFDDERIHVLTLDSIGGTPVYVGSTSHPAQRCPVVRYANRLDLEGRIAGEIEPFIPVLGRIDQTVFDRLVVQRFASWLVRTIAGMSVGETAAATGQTADAVKMRLRVEDFLIAEDPDTKFGSLPASPLSGFIDAHDADVRVLSAVSQTPAHEMLGQMANLSAEALQAARASQTAKAEMRRMSFGESHEQLLRLAAAVDGDEDGAQDFAAQVRWRDTDIRSLAQAADALGKLAQMLGLPPELLWEKIPGFTDQDVERARTMVAESGGMDALLRELVQATPPRA